MRKKFCEFRPVSLRKQEFMFLSKPIFWIISKKFTFFVYFGNIRNEMTPNHQRSFAIIAIYSSICQKRGLLEFQDGHTSLGNRFTSLYQTQMMSMFCYWRILFSRNQLILLFFIKDFENWLSLPLKLKTSMVIKSAQAMPCFFLLGLLLYFFIHEFQNKSFNLKNKFMLSLLVIMLGYYIKLFFLLLDWPLLNCMFHSIIRKSVWKTSLYKG